MNWNGKEKVIHYIEIGSVLHSTNFTTQSQIQLICRHLSDSRAGNPARDPPRRRRVTAVLYNGRRGVDLRSVHKPVPLSRATRGSATDHRGIKLATCRWLIYSRCACPNTDIGFVHREIRDCPYSEQIVKLVGQVDHQERL